MSLPRRLLLGLTGAALLLLSSPALAEEPDWTPYAQLLQQNLSRHTAQGIELAWVNYSALKLDGRFSQLVENLAAFDPAKLNGSSEKLAFYINAYNILALKMVLDHWPVASIKEVGNFLVPVWKKEAGRLGGRTVTLDELEHQILRPMGEPRLHLAIVCASLSCPDLRHEPYTAAQLERQLDDQALTFLRNPAKGLTLEGDKVRVSRIFSWFEEDFKGGVAPFLQRYRTDLPASFSPAADLPYNWSVNGH
ncbi:MAG: DUF547 domain-containing protein [Magnetococcales bacterium]|nr:DUF547 domain-containing protein [Magnetococcales bacterium]